MILIIAYEEAQARGVAYRLGLRPGQWRPYRYPEDLYGTRGVSVLLVNTAYLRRDYNDIMQVLRDVGAFTWHEHDYARDLDALQRSRPIKRSSLPPHQKRATRKKP